MNRSKNLPALAQRYAANLRKYLASEREASLEEAYELGRAAIAAEFGVLDMARIHLEARETLLRADAGGKNRGRITKLAGAFFLQALSPFEATHRGFRETNAELLKRNRELAAEIREHQQAKKALRESEQRFGTLIETAHDVIYSLLPDGRIELLNRAFEVITGWPRTAWLGKSFVGLLHPDDVPEAVAYFQSVMRGGPPERREYRVRKANGGYVIGEFTKVREMRDGQCVGVFGIGRDISTRKLAEAALRQSEERFRTMVAAIKDYVICRLDPAGRVASWNQGAERITQYRADEVLGRHCAAFYTPEDIASGKPQHALRLARLHGRYEEEGWRVRKDGSRFWADSTLAAIRDEASGLRGFVKVARDITERRHAEEALRQSEEHFRQLYHEAQVMQGKLRDLSNQILRVQEEERKRISRELHDEVGQSLTAISVTLAALRSNGASRKVALVQRLLEGTMETVHRFARELRPAMLDELGLLPALRSHVKNFSERTGLRVRLRADPAAEQLSGDQKTAVFRIAQESLTNVAKHARASRVSVSLRPVNGGVCLEIADNGQSFRADSAAAKQKGRLGLLGMQERVRLVNGQFSIQPLPGRGTTVRVTIPFPARAARP